MLIAVFVVGLVVSCAPIVAIVLVSVASRREDAEWTLNGGTPPGPVRAAARRVLDFKSEEIEWPRPKSRVPILTHQRTPDWELDWDTGAGLPEPELAPRSAVRYSGSYGRLRPSRSWAATQSSVTTAQPRETSPHSTVAATISASLRTLPVP